jgi:hypothetical protein
MYVTRKQPSHNHLAQPTRSPGLPSFLKFSTGESFSETGRPSPLSRPSGGEGGGGFFTNHKKTGAGVPRPAFSCPLWKPTTRHARDGGPARTTWLDVRYGEVVLAGPFWLLAALAHPSRLYNTPAAPVRRFTSRVWYRSAPGGQGADMTGRWPFFFGGGGVIWGHIFRHSQFVHECTGGEVPPPRSVRESRGTQKKTTDPDVVGWFLGGPKKKYKGRSVLFPFF